MKRTLLSWSSGKESAWALHLLRKDPETELLGLFTVTNRANHRASMHYTRGEMLRLQAEASGLPLQTIDLPDPCTKQQSDAIMGQFLTESVAGGIECMAFGDLFLEDIRNCREAQLEGTGIVPVFPLWGAPTGELAEEMLSQGVEAYVSSVDLKKLPSRFVGRKWTRDMIGKFPEDCDPCGENGEIHTIVVGGPMFKRSIPVRTGRVVERNGFAYADIIPMK